MPLILPARTLDSGGYEIDNSLRFNSPDTARLGKTISGTSNRKTFSLSFWLKKSHNDGNGGIMGVGTASTDTGKLNIRITGSDFLKIEGGATTYRITNRAFRDNSAWYNIFISFDSTQSTADNRISIYVNGVEETSFSTKNNPSQDANTPFNEDAKTHYIGTEGDGSAEPLDGYLAEFHYIDGTRKAHSDFGEFNDNGVWIPKAYDGSYGTHGFYLPFDNKGKIHSISVVGNTHHETDQKKFGDTSINFDGSGDELHVNDIGQLTFTGDFTVEFFAYLGDQGDTYATIINDVSNNRFRIHLGSSSNSTPKLSIYSSTWDSHIEGTSDIGDNAWHHCAIVRDNGTIRIFVDGTQETTSADKGNFIDVTGVLEIGTLSGSKGFTGYLDEIRISNIARYTSNFTPTTSIFSDDDNTRLLIHSDSTDGNTSFSDSSGVAGGIGNDSSGNNNDFTSTNINTQIDQTTDSPTNNWCTLNPLAQNTYAGGTLSEGNCEWTSGVSEYSPRLGTFGLSSGKWYWEIKPTLNEGSSNDPFLIGISSTQATANSQELGHSSNDWAYYNNGTYRNSDSNTSYGDTYTVNDIIGVALDLDNFKLYFSKNGTFQNSGDPTSGSTGTGALSITSNLSTTDFGFYFPALCDYDNSSGKYSRFQANFGNPPFSISSGNADANGYGNFEYAVPSGYYALCTKNLAEYG